MNQRTGSCWLYLCIIATDKTHCSTPDSTLRRRFCCSGVLIHKSLQLIREQRGNQVVCRPCRLSTTLGVSRSARSGFTHLLLLGGSHSPAAAFRTWRERFGMPIFEGYGLTETAPFASYNHRLEYVEGSIGMPVDLVEMKVIDPLTGEDCPVGQTGELAIRGPNVMLGYWNRRRTATVLRGGWFHSGDCRIRRRTRLFLLGRSPEGHDHGGRDEGVSLGSRARARGASGGPGFRRDRIAGIRFRRSR